MRKLIIVALLLAIPTMGMAVETFDNSRRVATIQANDYYYLLRVAYGDCLDVGAAGVGEDTTLSISLYPLGFDKPVPDAISIFGQITETASGLDKAIGDCVQVKIDVAASRAGVANAYWAPILPTAGSITYSSRTGATDTITGNNLTSKGNGSWNYAFTSDMLAACHKYWRIRYAYPALDAADDTVLTTIWVAYKWNHSNTD